MSALTSAAALAAYLGAECTDTQVELARTGGVMPSVTLIWDIPREALRLRAVVDLDELGVDHVELPALALAIARINVSLEVVGLEHDAGLAFVTHAFFDDGAVSAATVARLLAAVDACEARATAVLSALRTAGGAA